MTRLVGAWVVVNGVLLVPQWASSVTTGAPTLPWISLEAALIVGGMALLQGRRGSRAWAWILAGAVVLSAVVGLADLVFRVSLGRALDLSLDLYLLDAVRRLAVGNMGILRSSVLFLAVGAGSVLTTWGVAWLLTPAPRRAGEAVANRVPRLAAGLVGGTVALALLGLLVDGVGRRVTAPAASLAYGQATLFLEARAERAAFAADLAAPPASRPEGPRLLSGLAGRHVVLAYLESYGMAALEDPELAAVVRPRLETAAIRLGAAGLHVATGRLVSPTLGGQSWYAHGTMVSGLWLENQLRYELMLTSGRESLVHDFERAGYRTATLMPAITTAWPEALRLGFDDVYTSQNIPYEGPPFYWVTMPDQFTWSFLGGVLDRSEGPLFVEAGMVSSHAPWTPVLPLVDWGAMDSGRIFEPYRLEGYPPEEVWWDVEVLRDGYARSVAYALEAMVGFAERFLDERTLLIVAGDHQAAPWVTGVQGAEVPVHVMARDPLLLEPFVEWGFVPGTVPAAAAATHRMDAFREWFVQAYSER